MVTEFYMDWKHGIFSIGKYRVFYFLGKNFRWIDLNSIIKGFLMGREGGRIRAGEGGNESSHFCVKGSTMIINY